MLTMTRERKEMKPMFSPKNGRNEANERKTNQISGFALDRATHDIANQLSIIYLYCGELRQLLAEKLPTDQFNELVRIEVAVQEVARMIQRLTTSLHDQETTPKTPATVLKEIEATDSFYRIVSRPALRR
jgi:hypothetical protein